MGVLRWRERAQERAANAVAASAAAADCRKLQSQVDHFVVEELIRGGEYFKVHLRYKAECFLPEQQTGLELRSLAEEFEVNKLRCGSLRRALPISPSSLITI
ncbi:Protein of unknown function [Gryllus bimaculatus]|nr:Protein of unknown function [Gryllus bimaculatus]